MKAASIIAAALLLAGAAFSQSQQVADVRLLNFTSETSTPCREMEPILISVRAKSSVEDINISQASSRGMVALFRVEKVPTYIAVRNGAELGRIVGKASEKQLLEILGLRVGDERPTP